MDWIHCNLCSSQPRSSGPAFVLTSCGHIFCESCESRENVDQCKCCKSQCSVTKLTSNMSPDVRSYFEDIEEIAKRFIQTIRFQKNHRFNLLKAHKKMSEKYLAAKNHIRKLEAQQSALKRKLEQYEQYDESNAAKSPRIPEFVFTPNSNRRNTPVLNSIASQNSAQSRKLNCSAQSAKSNYAFQCEKPNFSFRLPDIQAYQQYRSGVQSTPQSSPVENTPRSNSANVYQKRNELTPLRGQSKFPMRTPPCDDIRRMRITHSNY